METVLSRFGITGVACSSHLVVLPIASMSEGGESTFDGRLGKIRYLGLASMAATGAIAPDLIQLVLPFPTPVRPRAEGGDLHSPDRAPIANPILLGHVLTHVAVALCATCGRARARSDSLDVPMSLAPNWNVDLPGSNTHHSVVEDCEGFLMLGVLARITQALLGALRPHESQGKNHVSALFKKALHDSKSSGQRKWIETCQAICEICLQADQRGHQVVRSPDFSVEEGCEIAASEACIFLREASVVAQILAPEFTVRFHTAVDDQETAPRVSFEVLNSLVQHMGLDPITVMLDSPLVRDVVKCWVDAALDHLHVPGNEGSKSRDLRARLRRTQGFRVYDWPSTGTAEELYSIQKQPSSKNADGKLHYQDISLLEDHMKIEDISPPASRPEVASGAFASPSLLSFSARKSVPLLGGFKPPADEQEGSVPRIASVPISYTDLYAELGQLLPECEQTAVCLVCGEVLDAGGKGECTLHSYKCSAGAGMFFLLQECSGLIMHKNKAAYIHSPYVDSHGETPQYRGRPLNLDLERYEHLREVWFSHGVRQKVVSERTGMRQTIVPDFY